MAEMIGLPAYQQIRILAEQKYPARNPQSFRVPYYQFALRGIRHYYRDGNDADNLAAARRNAGLLGNKTRAEHNLRVLNRFERSPQARRRLRLQSNPSLAHSIAGVELRLGADLRASERDARKCVYYNCRNVEIDPEVARLALEVAYVVMDENGQTPEARELEYVDLQKGEVHQTRAPRTRTLALLRENARVISTLWPTV